MRSGSAMLEGLIAGVGLAAFMAAGRRGGLLRKTLAEQSEDWLDRTVRSRSRLGATGTTALEQANHLAASAAFGFGYKLLRDRLPRMHPVLLGGAYGAGLYATNIAAIAPLLGITEGERKAGAPLALQRLGMHLLYGIGTAVAADQIAARIEPPAEPDAEARRALEELPARKFLKVDGITMSWLEQGEGVPVILLHGIPTSPELWRHVMPRLTGMRVLAWEMVGYGQSIAAGKGRDLSVAHQAEYLAAWMRQIGIEKAILAGHDLGGGVAQILAVRHPELCGGLLLTNAIGYDAWPIPSVKALRATAALSRHLPDPLFKALLMNLFVRGHDDSDEAKAAFHVHSRNYLDDGGAAALIRQIEWLDVSDTLAIERSVSELAIPARIVWGAADGFLTIDYAERFASDLRAPLRRIPGGKHFTPEDHPDIIAKEISALVRTVHSAAERMAPNRETELVR